MKDLKELRCSSLHRFMNCVGHKDLKFELPSEGNDAAKEGTAAGEYLTAMINQKTINPNFPSAAANGVFIDEEMKYHVRNVYEDILKQAQGAQITSEVRIDWWADSTVIRGQYDAAYVVGDILFVDDLKYGYGIVEVKKNWQLIGYAVGLHKLLVRQGIVINKVVLTVRQPRAYHTEGPIRHDYFTTQELIGYYHEIVAQVRAYTSGDTSLSTSNSCKYCEKGASCPALNAAYHNALDVVLTEYTEKELDNNDLARMIELLDRAKDIIKIKETSIKNLAINRIQNNQVVPGYGMVQKFGDRMWKPSVTAASIKMMTGVDVNEVTMMSPNKAEKAGVNKKLVEQLIVKPSKGFDLGKINVQDKANKLFNKGE